MFCLYNFQSELDTLTATLKQLENQKGEAQKRLNDLKSQVSFLLLLYIVNYLSTKPNYYNSHVYFLLI